MTAVDWSRYRKCPVCAAGIGEPCLSLLAGIEGCGRATETTDRPHGGREQRTGGK